MVVVVAAAAVDAASETAGDAEEEGDAVDASLISSASMK